MTAKKAMTKQELQTFKKQLEELRTKMYEEMDHFERDSFHKNAKEASGDLSGYGFHMADAASDECEQSINMELASKEQRILKEIDWALKKIGDGTYGICEMLNIPIAKERLKAIPYARYSKKAQEEEEKRSKESGGS